MKKTPKHLEIKMMVLNLTSGSFLIFVDSLKQSAFFAALRLQALCVLSCFLVNLFVEEASGQGGRFWITKS